MYIYEVGMFVAPRCGARASPGKKEEHVGQSPVAEGETEELSCWRRTQRRTIFVSPMRRCRGGGEADRMLKLGDGDAGSHFVQETVHCRRSCVGFRGGRPGVGI